MSDAAFRFRPVGIVRSPFRARQDIPVGRNAAPAGFDDITGTIEVFAEFEAGLADIDGFSHLFVIFAFHEADGAKLVSKPPFDDRRHGVFAMRSPHRPNPIGLTVVRLLGRDGRVLKVAGLDMIDGTPVLDIKPYTEKDRKHDIAIGWMA